MSGPLCIHCGEPFYANHVTAQKRCGTCRYLVAPVIGKAQNLVRAAIRRGEIPSLRGSHSIRCVDCGAAASQWDHRDYGKPLEVVPVCKSCNLKRGPGLVPGAKGDPAYRYVAPKKERPWATCKFCTEAGREAAGEVFYSVCDGCRAGRSLISRAELLRRLRARSIRRYGYSFIAGASQRQSQPR